MHRYHVMLTISSLMFSLFVLIGCGASTATVQPTTALAPATAVPPPPTIVPTPSPTATLTPSPKPTITPRPSPTPIVGITAPVMVNEIGVRVLSAVLGVDPPIGQQLKPGYKLLAVQIELTGNIQFADMVEKLNMTDSKVIDDQGNEGGLTFISVDFAPKPPFKTTLTYAMSEAAKTFTLRLPDGQTIDMAPVLKQT